MRKCYVIVDECLPVADSIIAIYTSKRKAIRELEHLINKCIIGHEYRIITEVLI